MLMSPSTKLRQEWACWFNLIDRCTNPKNATYPYYGGRGITVCLRWLKSFDAFFEDIGRRPTPQHSIDRIDNDGNYKPGNCRWATKKEQRLNQKKQITWMSPLGQTEDECRKIWTDLNILTDPMAAAMCDVSKRTLRRRFGRSGRPPGRRNKPF